MFEGYYNYTQVVAKCAAEGAIIAVAGDHNTYSVMYKMFMALWLAGGTINGGYIDGTKNHTNAGTDNWYCLNTEGKCPEDMPWQPGQPNYPQYQHCRRLSAEYNHGAGDSHCAITRMAFCSAAAPGF